MPTPDFLKLHIHSLLSALGISVLARFTPPSLSLCSSTFTVLSILADIPSKLVVKSSSCFCYIRFLAPKLISISFFPVPDPPPQVKLSVPSYNDSRSSWFNFLFVFSPLVISNLGVLPRIFQARCYLSSFCSWERCWWPAWSYLALWFQIEFISYLSIPTWLSRTLTGHFSMPAPGLCYLLCSPF